MGSKYVASTTDLPAVFNKQKKKKIAPKGLPAGMKAQTDEDGGRILLCDNTGGGAVMLRLIRFHYVRVNILTGPPFMYVCR